MVKLLRKRTEAISSTARRLTLSRQQQHSYLQATVNSTPINRTRYLLNKYKPKRRREAHEASKEAPPVQTSTIVSSWQQRKKLRKKKNELIE